MSKTLVVVPCGKRKIWNINPDAGPIKAKDVYRGAPFKVNRGYAERFSDRWVILSAKYGFIDPDFVIHENYNVTFKDKYTKPINLKELKRQVREKELGTFGLVVVLGGLDYAKKVTEAFSGSDSVIKKPIAGLRLGVAMHKVKEAVERNRPLT